MGGDHSRLGAHDARRFCRQHGLSADDSRLVAWLVEQHLTMSATAQKQDLTDPDVIAAFVAKVKTERRLVALYLLTVADIRGHQPESVERVEGEAARGSVSRSDGRPFGQARHASACRTASTSAGPRRAGSCACMPSPTAPSSSSGSAWTASISSATPPTKSPGTRATSTSASTPRSRWSRRGWRAKAPGFR